MSAAEGLWSHFAIYPSEVCQWRRHAFAVIVHEPEVVLCARVALLCSKAIPVDCFGVVLRHAFAKVVHKPEVVLCARIALIGGSAGRIKRVASHARSRGCKKKRRDACQNTRSKSIHRQHSSL